MDCQEREFLEAQLSLFGRMCKVRILISEFIYLRLYIKFWLDVLIMVVNTTIVFSQGNNAQTIEELTKSYISFEEALHCAESGTFAPSLRSQYVELIRGQQSIPHLVIVMCDGCVHVFLIAVMFVDVGDNRAVLDNLSFSFVSYTSDSHSLLLQCGNCRHWVVV